MVYVAYNALYDMRKGKSKGVPFMMSYGKSKGELERRMKRDNEQWNKKVGKNKFSASLAFIREANERDIKRIRSRQKEALAIERCKLKRVI
jgi:hypothetical protein